jgi:hypothetical protein
MRQDIKIFLSYAAKHKKTKEEKYAHTYATLI